MYVYIYIYIIDVYLYIYIYVNYIIVIIYTGLWIVFFKPCIFPDSLAPLELCQMGVLRLATDPDPSLFSFMIFAQQPPFRPHR